MNQKLYRKDYEIKSLKQVSSNPSANPQLSSCTHLGITRGVRHPIRTVK